MRRELEARGLGLPAPAELTVAQKLVPEAQKEAREALERGPRPYTPELGIRFLNAIRAGNSRETAAASVGVSRRILQHWLQLGEKGVEPYHTLGLEAEQAEAEAEVLAVDMIVRAARDDWRAAAWWLERSYPKKWGQKEQGMTLTVQASERTPADARRIMREQFGEVTPAQLAASKEVPDE